MPGEHPKSRHPLFCVVTVLSRDRTLTHDEATIRHAKPAENPDTTSVPSLFRSYLPYNGTPPLGCFLWSTREEIARQAFMDLKRKLTWVSGCLILPPSTSSIEDVMNLRDEPKNPPEHSTKGLYTHKHDYAPVGFRIVRMSGLREPIYIIRSDGSSVHVHVPLPPTHWVFLFGVFQ